MLKDLLSIKDLSSEEIADIFALTDELKCSKEKFSSVLSGKSLALIFQKPSNRTRVSFEVGMYQLGGHSLYLAPNEINLGVRESVEDVAKTLSRYIDLIVLRTFAHENVLELAKYSDKPVINGLSDFEHPCQALADIYTIREKLKNLKGLTIAYVGDGNNVCNSLIYACAKVGIKINVASPQGYEPKVTSPALKLFSNASKAVAGSDVVYTDVWASMGQEKEAAKRKKVFKSFQVNKELLKLAKKDVLVMHCLPAHRGQEITDEAIESRNSVVFDQAENRLHLQKAILIRLLGN
jgi:ornithine carbamoyltransferase